MGINDYYYSLLNYKLNGIPDIIDVCSEFWSVHTFGTLFYKILKYATRPIFVVPYMVGWCGIYIGLFLQYISALIEELSGVCWNAKKWLKILLMPVGLILLLVHVVISVAAGYISGIILMIVLIFRFPDLFKGKADEKEKRFITALKVPNEAVQYKKQIEAEEARIAEEQRIAKEASEKVMEEE